MMWQVSIKGFLAALTVLVSLSNSTQGLASFRNANSHIDVEQSLGSIQKVQHRAGELIVKLKAEKPLSLSPQSGSLFGNAFMTNPFNIHHSVKGSFSRVFQSMHLQGLGKALFKSINPALGKIKFSENISIEKAREILEENPFVEYAEPNVLFSLFASAKKGNTDTDPSIKSPTQKTTGTDPNLALAYGISKVKADQAWRISKGSAEVIVAVIDSGIDYNHKEISGNLWKNPTPDMNGKDTNKDGFEKDLIGWDFANDDHLPYDDNGHGTHCAGTIGAEGNNNQGISGVNQKVSIMALKFVDKNGSGSLDNAVGSIDYAIRNGAHVISASWGAPMPKAPQALVEAIERAEKAGILFVAAAGNGDLFGNPMNTDADPVFPSGIELENVISVAATDESDKLGSFSNFGKKTVDLSAPGVDVYSTVPGDQYKTLSGTSMATPHVAGAAALIKSSDKKLTYKDIKRKIFDSVDPVAALKDKTLTGGRLNVLRAIQ